MRPAFLSLFLLLIPCGTAFADEGSPGSSRTAVLTDLYESYFPAIVGLDSTGQKVLLKGAHRGSFTLSVLDARSKAQTVIDESEHSQIGPRWSDDGARIIYVVAADGGRASALRLASTADSRSHALGVKASAISDLGWAPDSRRISFIEKRNGRRELRVLLPDQTPVAVATLAAEGGYAWSPGGEALAYVPEQNPASLELVDLAKDTRQRVALGGTPTAFAWRGEGRRLVAAILRPDADFPDVIELNFEPRSIRRMSVTVRGEITDIRSIGSAIVYSEQYRGKRTVQLFQPETGELKSLSPTVDIATLVGVSEMPARVFSLEYGERGAVQELKETLLPGMERRTLYLTGVPNRTDTRCDPIQLRTSEGRSTYGFWWRRANPLSERRPLLIMVHGGPQLSYLPLRRPEIDALLESSIDVIQLNYSGSSGYGAKYAGEVRFAVTDVISTVNYAIKRLGYKTRDVFLLGDSYGAGVALQASSQVETGGLILLSYLGNVRGHGRRPARVLVFHGANDPVSAAGDVLENLKRYWGEEGPQGWWHVVDDEGHSFRKIGSWVSTLIPIIELMGGSASNRTVSESQ